jgi:hypothetical protein
MPGGHRPDRQRHPTGRIRRGEDRQPATNEGLRKIPDPTPAPKSLIQRDRIATDNFLTAVVDKALRGDVLNSTFEIGGEVEAHGLHPIVDSDDRPGGYDKPRLRISGGDKAPDGRAGRKIVSSRFNHFKPSLKGTNEVPSGLRSRPSRNHLKGGNMPKGRSNNNDGQT